MNDTSRETIPPRSPHEFHEYGGRRWPILLIYGLVALITAIALVFLGREVYRTTIHKTTQQPVSVKVQQTNNQPSKTSGKSSQAVKPLSTNNLPNNGPGNVAAIFTASAVAAGSLHYALMRRRRGA